MRVARQSRFHRILEADTPSARESVHQKPKGEFHALDSRPG
jgi:hypothetical protein